MQARIPGPKLFGSFSNRILSVLTLVMAVAMLGTGLGFWSLLQVSSETASMVSGPLATERLARELHAKVLVNVARAQAFALSSEPQVGDMLLPAIQQDAAAVQILLSALGGLLEGDTGRAQHQALERANQGFAAALRELKAARDGGLTARIEEVYSTRFAPAADALTRQMLELAQAQTGRIDGAVDGINRLSLSARWGLVLFSACALAVGAVLSLWLARSITQPIRQAVDTANRVAALDLTEAIEGHDRHEGGHLLGALQKMQQSLHSLVAQVQQASSVVSESATEMAQVNQNLSTRSEKTASGLVLAAAAVEQISAIMRQSMDAGADCETLVASATEEAQGGGVAMGEVMETMNEIGASSRRIVDITTVIDSLAFQTNILALNAAVEAARAGDEGRGFAVVAAEVRALANRSATAAREIKGLIASSAATIERGTDKVGQSLDKMKAIEGSVQKLEQAVLAITLATREQTTGLSEISYSVGLLDQMTRRDVSAVQESAATAQRLQAQAGQLNNAATQFQLPASLLQRAPSA